MYKFFMKLIGLIFVLIFAGGYIKPVGGEDIDRDVLVPEVVAEVRESQEVSENVTEVSVNASDQEVYELVSEVVLGVTEEVISGRDASEVAESVTKVAESVTKVAESVTKVPESVTKVPESDSDCQEVYEMLLKEDYTEAFMEGFNSLRMEKSLEPISDELLYVGLMEGAARWCDTMIESGRVYHSDYSWMRGYRLWDSGYTSIVEGVNCIESFSYEALYNAGRKMCAHTGLNDSKVLVGRIGISVKEGIHMGNEALYICVAAITKEE